MILFMNTDYSLNCLSNFIAGFHLVFLKVLLRSLEIFLELNSSEEYRRYLFLLNSRFL